MINLIKYFEENCECSGLCRPPLFYLTVPVTKGPPKNGCAYFIMEAIDEMLGNLALTFFASAIIFFLMVFIICPICCLDDNPIPMGEEQAVSHQRIFHFEYELTDR